MLPPGTSISPHLGILSSMAVTIVASMLWGFILSYPLNSLAHVRRYICSLLLLVIAQFVGGKYGSMSLKSRKVAARKMNAINRAVKIIIFLRLFTAILSAYSLRN